MLPTTLVLCQGNDHLEQQRASVLVPAKAQELHSTWRHSQFFPQGVSVFRSVPLSPDVVNHLDLAGYTKQRRAPSRRHQTHQPFGVWLTLLVDRRVHGAHGARHKAHPCRSSRRRQPKRAGGLTSTTMLEPNYHRLPRDLDTMAFFGNLMLVISLGEGSLRDRPLALRHRRHPTSGFSQCSLLDGGKIIPLTNVMYNALLWFEESAAQDEYSSISSVDMNCGGGDYDDESEYSGVCTMDQSLSSMNDAEDDPATHGSMFRSMHDLCLDTGVKNNGTMDNVLTGMQCLKNGLRSAPPRPVF